MTKNTPEQVEESDSFDNHSEKGVLGEDERDTEQEAERCTTRPVSLRAQ